MAWPEALDSYTRAGRWRSAHGGGHWGSSVSDIWGDSEKVVPPARTTKTYSPLDHVYCRAIPVVGVLSVRVKYGTYEGTQDWYVVEGDGPTLLGHDWLQSIKLDWKSLGVVYVGENRPLTLTGVLQEHQEVFRNELGLMTQFEAKLTIKKDRKPVFVCPWLVPYTLWEPLEQALDRMEDSGVIEKVNHSEWAAPIVVVPKSDGTVRICGDYKVTVNSP